ncbi:MAG TPA: SGNH/GDSL hydrolase family protein [Candidatus Dormibacteraeota bacterium]
MDMPPSGPARRSARAEEVTRGLPTALRRLTRVALIALYLAGVALLAGAILEAVARTRNLAGYVRSSSPRLVYALRPGYAGNSSTGHRDREYSRTKPPGVFRVIGLGDSYSYGMGVARDRVFLKVAEEELNRRLARPVEVINFGVPGYNTAMEAAVLEEVTPAWQPDLVVIQFCGNDFNLPNFIQTRTNGLIARSFALHLVLSHLARTWPTFVKKDLMRYWFDGEVFPAPGLEHVPIENYNPIRDPGRSPAEYRYMLGEAGVRAAFRAIRAESRRRSLPVLLLVGWGGGDREVAQWAEAEGLAVADMWPAIQRHLAETGRGFKSLWVAPPLDNHPNQEGHAIIGRMLAEKILELGLLAPK